MFVFFFRFFCWFVLLQLFLRMFYRVSDLAKRCFKGKIDFYAFVFPEGEHKNIDFQNFQKVFHLKTVLLNGSLTNFRLYLRNAHIC